MTLITQSLRNFGPAAFACLALLGIAVLSSSPKQGEDVAVVFPPWWETGDLLEAADKLNAKVRAGGTFANILVLKPTPGSSKAALYQAGALLVLPSYAALGCFANAAEPTPRAKGLDT